MDNFDYLNKIATKPASQQGNRLLSPFIIKILIAAAALLVLLIVLGNIVNNANAKNAALYHSFHLRLKNLSADSGPIATYTRDINSSDLRALAGTLKTALFVAAQDFSGVFAQVKIDPTEISEDTSASESNILATYTQTLQDAKLNGLLDRTFANATTLQISLLLTKGSEILERNPPDSVAATINQIMERLDPIHTRLVELNNNSN